MLSSCPATVLPWQPSVFKLQITNFKLQMPLAACFNERDLVNFFQRRDSRLYLIQRRLTQEVHAFTLRGLANLRARTLCQNHFADVVRQIKQLMDRRSSAESRAAALNAA